MLTVIIVNYRSGSHLSNCLRSLGENGLAGHAEILIIDNSPEEEIEPAITQEFPFVSWVRMTGNAGFARANNAGIRIAKGDCVLLLNPDTLVVGQAIQDTYRDFNSSRYVACGLQLLNPDGSPQISGNYAMKGGLNYLLPLPYIGWVLKTAGKLFGVSKPHADQVDEELTEVDWINGAFLMVKREVIEKAGMLDEDFFLYAEEAEWCSRLRKFGPLAVYNRYRVIHLQGESANDAFNSSGKGYYNLYDKKGFQIMLSNFLRIRKEFGVSWFLLDLMVYSLTIPVYLLAGFFHRLVMFRNPFGHLLQWAAFTKNVWRLWTYAPRILSGEPYFYKAL